MDVRVEVILGRLFQGALHLAERLHDLAQGRVILALIEQRALATAARWMAVGSWSKPWMPMEARAGSCVLSVSRKAFIFFCFEKNTP